VNSLNIHEVLQHLPHRYPFLLIDRVQHFEPGESLKALKNVSFNEHFFPGHFPGHPVFPGVLILEAMAQASAILAFRSLYKTPDDGTLYLLVGIDGARFKRKVEPGDQMIVQTNVQRMSRGLWKFEATASVDGELACGSEIRITERRVER
jgi:3-hydroxyacyl-[acyl-carrier-protein] dehydratase